jgi:branched-chain amino acid transport system ATP-binding protein
MQALSAIRAEHRSLAAVIHGLVHLVRSARDVAPDFALLAAMLRYIEDFPERFHHPKEDEWLFARLRQRHAPAAALVDALQREHAEGAWRIRALRRALGRWQAAQGDIAATGSARDAFVELAGDYATFHWEHMRREELEAMPLCEAHFEAGDWAAIDAAFAAHDDPLSGASPATEFAELFRRIVRAAPPPVGTGEQGK